MQPTAVMGWAHEGGNLCNVNMIEVHERRISLNLTGLLAE